MSSNNEAGMLGTGASKPPAFRRIVNLYNADLPFRGLIDFAVIGAAVMLFLHPPSAETLGSLKLSDLTGFFKSPKSSDPKQAINTQPGSGGNVQTSPGTNVQPLPAPPPVAPTVKIAAINFEPDINRPALSNVMIVEIDDAMFRSSSAADQPKLLAAARAHRSRKYDDILGILKDARDSDVNVAFMRGMAAGNSSNAEVRKSAFQYFKAAADGGHPIASVLVGRMLITGADGLTKNVELGRQLIEKAAAGGSRLAQRAAAIAYINGEFGAFDPVKARDLFAQAAKAGDPQAMLHYANMLFNGISGPRDTVAGEDFLRRSAASGLTSAQRTLGGWIVAQYDEKLLPDPKEGVEWLERASNVGHSVSALLNLSALYANIGRTPPWNSKDTYFEVINKCSGINEANCQFNTGLAYHFGWGTKRDFVRAYAHYQLARNLGDSNSTRNAQIIEKEMTANELSAALDLARHLQSNIKPVPPLWHMQYAGVEPPASPWVSATYLAPKSPQGDSGDSMISFGEDFIKPNGWFYRLLDIDYPAFDAASVASKGKITAAVRAYREGRPGSEILNILKDADQNDPNVMYLRAVGLYTSHEGQNADENRQAKQLVTQAVQAGQKDAEVFLALLLLYHDRGIERDTAEGRRLLEAAVARNDRHALRQMGIIQASGLLGNPDFNTAAQYMKRAASASDPIAHFVMAAYYEKAIGVPRDMKLAEDSLRQSARLGYTLAQSVLGEWQTRISRLNKGANPEEGLKWLDRAFQGKNFNALANAMLLHIDAPKDTPWRNHAKAFELSKSCVEFKFGRCLYYVGFLMEYGDGLKHDLMRSFAYYDAARAVGGINPTSGLNRLEKKLTSNEIASARDLSEALQKRLKALPLEFVFQPPTPN